MLDGRFKIPTVPARQDQDELSSAPVQDHGGGSHAHVPFETVEIRAGETTVVNYDENGAEIRVRVQWPADFEREQKQQVMAMMTTPFPQPPAEIIGNAGSAEGVAGCRLKSRTWRRKRST